MQNDILRDDTKELLEKLQLMRGAELDEILKAVMRRYSELLPEHELVCIFLPKYDSEERKRILSWVERFCFPWAE